MKFSHKWLLASALGGGLLLGAVEARVSQACGGLFCSTSSPVNQAAERIIFSFDRKAKKVTAVVEILYQGPSEKFAWVLPVPGSPKVGVSTSAMLDRLQAVTNPTYQIQRDWTGSTCNNRGPTPTSGNGNFAPGAPSTPGGDNKGVTVLASGAVGPYLYDTIMVNPAQSDPAMVAIEWLQMNGYDVSPMTGEVLRPYLRDGLNLIAFRLNKPAGKMAGSIRPIMLTYDSEHPMIPIRPTAVAANNDMGILAFVLGDARAVPINYRTLELNDAAIDWFNPNTTYNAVVSAAADEGMSKGQGFVTEFAGATSTNNFATNLYQERVAVEAFRRTADGMAPAGLIIDAIEKFSTQAQGGFMGPFAGRPSGGRVALDGVTDAILASGIVLPADVTIDQVVESPRCFFGERTAGYYCEGKKAPAAPIDLTTFDKVKFLDKIEELVISPLESTANLFATQRYLTRLYTTLSAAEMTLDPTFDINDELESQDVSNQHTVTLKYPKACAGDTNGEWVADFNGFFVRGTGNTWPVKAGTTMMPFNRRVTQMASRGQPMVLSDNNLLIAAALGGTQPPVGGSSPPRADSSGGCSVASGAAATLPVWLLGAPLLLAWRRRRPRA